MKKERNWKIGSLLADKIIFLSTILICSLQYAICVEKKQFLPVIPSFMGSNMEVESVITVQNVAHLSEHTFHDQP